MLLQEQQVNQRLWIPRVWRISPDQLSRLLGCVRSTLRLLHRQHYFTIAAGSLAILIFTASGPSVRSTCYDPIAFEGCLRAQYLAWNSGNKFAGNVSIPRLQEMCHLIRIPFTTEPDVPAFFAARSPQAPGTKRRNEYRRRPRTCQFRSSALSFYADAFEVSWPAAEPQCSSMEMILRNHHLL
jgi:hypothetical protein